LPDSLEQKCRTIYRGSSDAGTWHPPATVTHDERRAALAYLQTARHHHPAPAEDWLKGRIATLLAHYFVATAHESVNAMIAQDWLDSLAPLPKTAIAEACAWWRDNETRKPKPADIRKKAIEIFGESEWERLMRLKIIAASVPVAAPEVKKQEEQPWQKPTEEQKAKVRELVEKACQSMEMPR